MTFLRSAFTVLRAMIWLPIAAWMATSNICRGISSRIFSTSSRPRASTAARGQEVFTSSGCGECHTIRGTEATGDVGPDLTHFASRPRLGAGVAPNTTERLTAWISDPHELKRGVDMPASELSDEDLAAVVAYLEGLE